VTLDKRDAEDTRIVLVKAFAGMDKKIDEIFTRLSHDCNNTSV
jgi:hypothetical protein